jgi:hypothetical protein
MWPSIVINFFIVKPTDALIFQIHFLAKINLGNHCVCWFHYKEIPGKNLPIFFRELLPPLPRQSTILLALPIMLLPFCFTLLSDWDKAMLYISRYLLFIINFSFYITPHTAEDRSIPERCMCVCVGFVVDKVKFGLFSLRVLRYLAVSIIPPIRHMHIAFA